MGTKRRATESVGGGRESSGLSKKGRGLPWAVRPTQSCRLYLLILFIFWCCASFST